MTATGRQGSAIAPGEVPQGEDPASVVDAYHARQEQWLEAVSRGDVSLEDDPCPLGPVVRVYDATGSTLDLRTGIAVRSALPTPQVHRAFLLSQLPLPPELLA